MNTTTANPEITDQTSPQPPPQTKPEPEARPQPLCRPIQDRMLAGVAVGIARYAGVDVTIVRIVFAVLAIVGGAGVPLYLAAWLLIPEEGSEQSIATGFIQSLQNRAH
jgi:phage shock protein PspC (stress-responsive transcriptional regulator)